MFEFAASSVAFAHVTFEEACAHLAAAGFKQIDLWNVRKMCEHLPTEDTALDLARIRKALRNSGLKLYSMSLYFAKPEVTLARLEQLAELGGKAVVRDCSTHKAEGHSTRDVIQRAEAFVARAEKLGVLYTLENHSGCALETIADMQEVARALPSKNFGIAYAPIHSDRVGEDPSRAIRELGRRLAFYYAWDRGPASAKDWRDVSDQLPGTGKLSFHEMFAALNEIEFNEPLCVFAHGLEDLPAADAVAGLKKAVEFCKGTERKLRGRKGAQTATA